VTEPVWEEPDPYLRTPQTVDAQERWAKASGIERLRYLQNSEYPTPMMQLLGLRALAVTEGEATMTMAASKWLNNFGGTIYGGATTCLAEGT
jgi:acyl-coenzyme A thioesterase PaaI-like protein